MEKKANAFTTTEILITLVLIAILSAVAYAKYIDFQNEARQKVVEKFASDMQSAIQMKDYFVQMECNALRVGLNDILANDVTEETCDPALVPVAQRRFVNMHPEDFPKNPQKVSSTIVTCNCMNGCEESCLELEAGFCFNEEKRTFFALNLNCEESP